MATQKKPPLKTSAEETAAAPQSFEEALKAALPRLEAMLKSIPPEQLAAAKKEVEQLFKGDLSWADLSQYTPEKLLQMAKMGYHQFQIGQYDSAERLFKGLTVVDPSNFYYHQMLGAIFQRKEKFPEAIVEYAVAVRLNPKDVVSFANRGECYFRSGVAELASADFDQAIALDSKGENRWANRAKMLREQIRLMKKGKK